MHACRCTPATGRHATRTASAARCSTASTCASRCRSLTDERTARRCPAASRRRTVAAARAARRTTARVERQGKRQRRRSPAREIDRLCQPEGAGQAAAARGQQRLGWSARAYHRVLKVARTIADLEGADELTAGARGRGDPVPPLAARVLIDGRGAHD
ncbi:MAG: hypothetical protein MZW92_25055 [Comamonadaceae bacterium]|nr:hypothetical protein [Comamonadaceae bacterium]